jgi:uncharacterized Fe-S radical SAM superfamily protein PflX
MNYLELYKSGELARRIDELKELLEPCRLCPRECGASRIQIITSTLDRDKMTVPLSSPSHITFT